MPSSPIASPLAGGPAAVAALAGLLDGARRVLAFTGAGISTASGIPDFRGPGGVWSRRQPVYLQDFLAGEAARVEYWEQKVEAHEHFRGARPNATHDALVALERAGRLVALVTQNIDGLHQTAGSSSPIELHGTNRLVECLGCGAREEPDDAVARFVATRRCPTCARCGGLQKFATISFGQALDQTVLARAFAAADEADLVLALGSTLSVHPAASVPLAAVERGAPYVIINRGPTEQDERATLRIEGAVEEVLPPAVARVLERAR